MDQSGLTSDLMQNSTDIQCIDNNGGDIFNRCLREYPPGPVHREVSILFVFLLSCWYVWQRREAREWGDQRETYRRMNEFWDSKWENPQGALAGTCLQ